jgi:hypothetical protein
MIDDDDLLERRALRVEGFEAPSELLVASIIDDEDVNTGRGLSVHRQKS